MKKTPIFILSAVLLFSCKKDSEETCATNTASVSGNYKVKAVTYKENAAAPEIDYYTVWYTETCERDDIITFNANGTYQSVDAGVVCTPSNSDDGTWSLVGNTIQLDGDPATIESFDCKSLVISIADGLVNGDKIKMILTKQ